MVRHGFTALVIDRLAHITLGCGAFFLALFIGGFVTLLAYLGAGPPKEVELGGAGVGLIIIGAIAFLVAFHILHFVAFIILSIVDASYACMVLDFDSPTPKQPQMIDAIKGTMPARTVVAVQSPNDATPQVAVVTGVPMTAQMGSANATGRSQEQSV